jgi:hypothetical protein
MTYADKGRDERKIQLASEREFGPRLLQKKKQKAMW